MWIHFGVHIVTNCFVVTVTLTSGLNSRKIVSMVYIITTVVAFIGDIHGRTSVFMQTRRNFPYVSYLSETQKNHFQLLTHSIV